MESETGALYFDKGEPGITRQVVGEDVVLFCRGLAVASFRRGDELGRDVAIATLLRLGLGLTTDTIAELCGASHGWVCNVRKRVRAGGITAVLARAKPGPARRMVGRKEERLREMHGAGTVPRVIAKQLGVSMSLVSKEIKRLGLPPRGWAVAQEVLPSVGKRGTRGAKTPKSGPEDERTVQPASGQDVAQRDNQTAEAIRTPLNVAMEEAARTESPDDVVRHEETSEAPENHRNEERSTLDLDVDLDEPASREDPTAEAEVREAVDSASLEEAILAAVDDIVCDGDERQRTKLMAGVPLEPGPAEHPCRYAGTLLLCAAAAVIGVTSAINVANVVRPETSIYGAHQVLLALMAAWGAGYRSLEAMHERDAHALGVVLGLERSPSVRTLHRAIAQMSAVFDPIELGAALMRGVLSARMPERMWFGADGHFKAYSGQEPIDKGWDSKRRIASKGIADVVITDERGWAWQLDPVAAGDSLSKHLLAKARTLRGVIGDARPIVMAFDRGGFDFDVLDALDLDGFAYVGYVPASVSLPDLSAIAPSLDGVGEEPWSHSRLHHKARFLVERDGEALIPAVTNLPTLVDAAEVMRGLRARRGAQENSFKSARAFAHIDALVDRGGAAKGPDDRLVKNPARSALKKEQELLHARIAELKDERPTPGEKGRSRADIENDRFLAAVDEVRLRSEVRATPVKVPRVTIEPDAQRATLKTRHRLLLQPLKFATDNARRWLLEMLGSALAPTDHVYDQEALPRTLLALLRAPGKVHFDTHLVTVTLDFPIPPTAHQRIAAALVKLDHTSLLFTDARRRVVFRLAPRPTRESLHGRV